MLLEGKSVSVYLRASGERLVDSVSYRLDASESLVILGQSGSGKTMSCKALMGILNRRQFYTEGEIFFQGEELLSLAPQQKRRIYGSQIAMIPQNPMTALDPSARIGRQMAETLRLHEHLSKRAAQARCMQALEQAGMNDVQRVYHSYPYMLSGGMLQRVLIAMALMVQAKLIVADEPTTALDAMHKNETVDSFTTLRENGAAILLVTHDFAVAARLGGKLLIMKDGAVIEQGQMQDILAQPKHPYTAALLGASRLSAERERGEAAC